MIYKCDIFVYSNLMLVKIMPVIIHIGYPKTATTWFQEVYFPSISNYHFESFREVNKVFLNSDCLAFNSDKAKGELLRKSINGNLLLSSEFLTTGINFGWHHGYYSAGVAQKIHATFPDATIIIFIRRQQSLICSAYQQYIKNGGTYGFKRWLYSGEVFSPEHLCFDKLIDYYDKLFSIDQVKVYLYEEFKEDNISFLSKMNKELGFQVDFNDITFKPLNMRLRNLIVPMMLFVNLFYKKPVGLKRYIIHIPGMTSMGRAIFKYLNPLSIFGNYLSESSLLKVSDNYKLFCYYSKSNKLLANRVGEEKLKYYGYYL